jgi:hypothetical protein
VFAGTRRVFFLVDFASLATSTSSYLSCARCAEFLVARDVD